MLRVLSHSRTPRPLTTHHTQVVCDRSGAGSSNNRDEVLVCEGDLIGKRRGSSLGRFTSAETGTGFSRSQRQAVRRPLGRRAVSR